MSASAQNYAYVVKVSDKSKEIPVISKERLEEAKKDAASLRKQIQIDIPQSR